MSLGVVGVVKVVVRERDASLAVTQTSSPATVVPTFQSNLLLLPESLIHDYADRRAAFNIRRDASHMA
jgi:hypothetical protein